jgi:hypothetical protein
MPEKITTKRLPRIERVRAGPLRACIPYIEGDSVTVFSVITLAGL